MSLRGIMRRWNAKLSDCFRLSGIPCPDHRIAPDAKWDNMRYYCDLLCAENRL